MLIEFFGKECPHCLVMEPIIKKIEENGISVKRYEVWHDAENARLMETYDPGGEFCGGVPLFVNKETGERICGEASYEEILRLADGR